MNKEFFYPHQIKYYSIKPQNVSPIMVIFKNMNWKIYFPQNK